MRVIHKVQLREYKRNSDYLTRYSYIFVIFASAIKEIVSSIGNIYKETRGNGNETIKD